MIYYFIFIILVASSYLSEFKINSQVKILLAVIVSILLLGLTGLRGPVDGDYESYRDIFIKITMFHGLYSDIVEPGFVYLVKGLFSLGFGFNSVLFCMAILSLLPKFFVFYESSSNFSLTLLVFFSTSFFIFDFTQIRQALSIGLFMLSLRYVLEKKFWHFFVCILIAAAFHVSAVFLIPGFFVFNRRYNRFILFSIIVACSIISFMEIKLNVFQFFIEQLNNRENFSSKLMVYERSEIYSFISLKQVILASLFIYIKDSPWVTSRFSNILVNLYVFGIFISTLLNQISEVAFRMKWYFFWTEALLVISLVAYVSKNIFERRILVITFLMIYYMAALVILLDNLSNNGQFIYPYKFFFEN